MDTQSTELLNSLMDISLSYGCDILEKGQNIYPFLFIIDKNDQLNQAKELTQEEKLINTNDLVESFKITLQEEVKNKTLYGFAIGLAVKIERFKNEGFIKAIEIQLEHSILEKAHYCYLPYKENDGKISYGQLFALQKDKKII